MSKTSCMLTVEEAEVKERVRAARYAALKAVNKELVGL